MNARLALLAFSVCLLGATPTNDVVRVGNTAVHLVQTTGARGPSFFHPHEDEHIAAVVTRAFVRENGGTLLELKSEGKRRVAFSVDGRRYSFDPNRIFTDTGLRMTLGTSDAVVTDPVKLLRDSIIAKLKLSGVPIVAVHNNVDMSIDSYQTGKLANEAGKVAKRAPRRPHEFFLVVDEKLFQKLSDAGFNVVLQSRTPTDDGSLSVYCQNTDLPYVNVEAGNAVEQRRMLEALVPLLSHAK